MTTNNDEWSFRAGILYEDQKCTCDRCTAQHETTMTAPNPYERDIAALRGASATAATTFEENFKKMRQREFARARAAIDATPRPRLTVAETADLAQYAPPDPYEKDLRALRAKEGR